MKEKGVETAIEAVEAINKSSGREVCKLDIYGRIDDGYKNRFEELMQTVSSAVNYKGMVPYDKSVEAIKDYYAFCFLHTGMVKASPELLLMRFQLVYL